MAEPDIRGVWRARLRWRLRGAMLWPAFFAAIALDAVLLHLLPIAGETAPGAVGALLLSGFFNLLVVAIGVPLAGRALRRARPALPRVIADDRAGTALLGALAVVLVVLGILHRPAVTAERDAFAAQVAAARQWIVRHAPAEYRGHFALANTWKQGPGLYRTCVPGPDPLRALCLLVLTDRRPVVVRRDPDERPNAVAAGPDASIQPVG